MKQSLFISIKTLGWFIVASLLVACDKTEEDPVSKNESNTIKTAQPTWTAPLNPYRVLGAQNSFTYGDLLIVRSNHPDGYQTFAAINKTNGNVEWYLPTINYGIKYEYEGYLHKDCFVIVGVDSSANESKSSVTLFCFNLSTQQIIWQKDLLSPSDYNHNIRGIGEDCYYLSCEGPLRKVLKTNIYSGDTVCVYESNAQESGMLFTGSIGLISHNNKELLVLFEYGNQDPSTGETDKYLVVIDRDTFEIITREWVGCQSFAIDIKVRTHEDKIFFRMGETLYCFDTSNNTFIWEHTIDSFLMEDIIIYGNSVYRIDTDKFYGININTGAVFCRAKYGDIDNILPSWAVVDSDYVYLFYASNSIRVYKAQTGKLVGELTPENMTTKFGVNVALTDNKYLYITTYNDIRCYPKFSSDKWD